MLSSTFNQLARRLAAVEDRLEQEYLEDCTDPNIGWNGPSSGGEQEQSGGPSPEAEPEHTGFNHLRASSPDEADYRNSFSETHAEAAKIFARPSETTRGRAMGPGQ